MGVGVQAIVPNHDLIHFALGHQKMEVGMKIDPLGMAGGTESAGLAGEGQEMICPAARTADPGESAARIAAIKILLDDVLDDRPEIPILPLEPALILGQNRPRAMPNLSPAMSALPQ